MRVRGFVRAQVRGRVRTTRARFRHRRVDRVVGHRASAQVRCG